MNGFRDWYDANRCDGAPPFKQFWAYAKTVLRNKGINPHDNVEPIVKACDRAFRKFDPTRGNPNIPPETRFNTCWLYLFRTEYRRMETKSERKWRKNRVPLDAETTIHQLNKKAIQEMQTKQREQAERDMLEDAVRGVIDTLPTHEKQLMVARYWYGKAFSDIAKDLEKRKADVLAMHADILKKLESDLGFLNTAATTI